MLTQNVTSGIDEVLKQAKDKIIMALAFLIDPSLFEFTRGNARVSTDTLNRGQTSVAPIGSTMSPFWLEASLIDVATKVDHERLRQLYLDTYAL